VTGGGNAFPRKGNTMDYRTMIKFSATGDYVALHTISRKHHAPHRFIIPQRELKALEKKENLLIKDLNSFAELRLSPTAEGKTTLEITFYWLCDQGCGDLCGHTERLLLPYEKFLCMLEESHAQGGETKKLLSCRKNGKPRIEFYSRGNLQEVIQRKDLRRKLGKFLDRHFNWPDAMSIQISDDFVPYSFFFTEKRATGNGLCGGIILHGQENLKKAYYGMHT